MLHGKVFCVEKRSVGEIVQRNHISKIIKNLVIFKNLREDPLIKALGELLACDEKDSGRAFSLLCDLCRELYPYGSKLSERIFQLICADDNLYIRAIASAVAVLPEVASCAKTEITALSAASEYTADDIALIFKITLPVPKYSTEKMDMLQLYLRYAKNADKNGIGIFADRHMFTVTETGGLAGVKNPDDQRISELYGYEVQRQKVVENTRALLAGIEANNVLLYGDAGTGKSSTVKAIANEFPNEGLRLIQVEKSLLRFIPKLMDELASIPMKFIIFIDDLSFNVEDRSFTALKTILEGSVAARAKNTVVYATSNRRHLLKESFSDRHGDDVHLSETLEEAGSLAARFGIVITFSRPDKDDYEMLVLRLAQRYGVRENKIDLLVGAEAFALRNGGRSPRVAKQYIEYKSSKIKNNF